MYEVKPNKANIHFCEPFLQIAINGLARIVGIRTNSSKSSSSVGFHTDPIAEGFSVSNVEDLAAPDQAAIPDKRYQGPKEVKEGGALDLSPMMHDVRQIKAVLMSHFNRITEKEEENMIAQEWRTIAGVLDRIFFIIYLSIIVISLAIMFPKT